MSNDKRHPPYQSNSSTVIKRLNVSPHPPREPCENRSESINRTRQRRFRRQSSETRNDSDSLTVREIRSAGCTAENSLRDYRQPCISKSKISSAPSPRNKTTKHDRSNNMYTFDSYPSLIENKEDTKNFQRPKKTTSFHSIKTSVNPLPSRSSQSIFASTQAIATLPQIDTTPSMVTETPAGISLIRPARSQASPIVANYDLNYTRQLRKIDRHSLQIITKEKFIEKARKSLPGLQEKASYCLTNSDSKFNSYNPLLLQTDLSTTGHSTQSILVEQPDEPINLHLTDPIASGGSSCNFSNALDLGQYQSPDNVTDSFELNILAQMKQQFTGEDQALIKNIPEFLSKFFPKCSLSDTNTQSMIPHNQSSCGSPSIATGGVGGMHAHSQINHQSHSHHNHNLILGQHLHHHQHQHHNHHNQQQTIHHQVKGITPRTEALIGGSYSDEDSVLTSASIATSTGPNICHNSINNNNGNNQPGNLIGPDINKDFHDEWRLNNHSSLDTCCSTDAMMSTFNESLVLDEAGGDSGGLSSRKSSNLSSAQQCPSPRFITVLYMHNFGCYYEPDTGTFYETAATTY